MTIQITRWSPDTCDCIIEYEWDDSIPQDQRTHTLSNYVRKCAAHSTLASDTTRYQTVIEENPRKNVGLQTIIDNAPAAFVDTDAQTGRKKLKAGLSLTYTVAGTAPNRVFTLIFGGATLTQTQIDFVQNKLDTRFGAGKVIFQNVP